MIAGNKTEIRTIENMLPKCKNHGFKSVEYRSPLKEKRNFTKMTKRLDARRVLVIAKKAKYSSFQLSSSEIPILVNKKKMATEYFRNNTEIWMKRIFFSLNTYHKRRLLNDLLKRVHCNLLMHLAKTKRRMSDISLLYGNNLLKRRHIHMTKKRRILSTKPK